MRGGLGLSQKETTGAVKTGAKVRKLRFPKHYPANFPNLVLSGRSALKRRLPEGEGEDGEERVGDVSHKKRGAEDSKARKKSHRTRASTNKLIRVCTRVERCGNIGFRKERSG